MVSGPGLAECPVARDLLHYREARAGRRRRDAMGGSHCPERAGSRYPEGWGDRVMADPPAAAVAEEVWAVVADWVVAADSA